MLGYVFQFSLHITDLISQLILGLLKRILILCFLKILTGSFKCFLHIFKSFLFFRRKLQLFNLFKLFFDFFNLFNYLFGFNLCFMFFHRFFSDLGRYEAGSDSRCGYKQEYQKFLPRKQFSLLFLMLLHKIFF